MQAISIDYDEIRISLLESTNRRVAVACRGYVGYSMVGFWDEAIVERADFDPGDEFLGECLRRIGSRYPQGIPDTGSPERNRRSWNVLRIVLSDGAVLKVAAAQFVAEETAIATAGG
jgi:hypothetical protein